MCGSRCDAWPSSCPCPLPPTKLRKKPSLLQQRIANTTRLILTAHRRGARQALEGATAASGRGGGTPWAAPRRALGSSPARLLLLPCGPVLLNEPELRHELREGGVVLAPPLVRMELHCTNFVCRTHFLPRGCVCKTQPLEWIAMRETCSWPWSSLVAVGEPCAKLASRHKNKLEAARIVSHEGCKQITTCK